MRKSVVVVLLSILLTGCFSHKKVNLDQIELKREDRYKITTGRGNIKKGKFHSKNESLIVLKGRRGNLFEILREEIQEVKRR